MKSSSKVEGGGPATVEGSGGTGFVLKLNMFMMKKVQTSTKEMTKEIRTGDEVVRCRWGNWCKREVVWEVLISMCM